jgi:hypothetical protein
LDNTEESFIILDDRPAENKQTEEQRERQIESIRVILTLEEERREKHLRII